MRSDFKPACLWSWTLLAWQPLVRFQSNYFMLSFPCRRSTELPSLPIRPPCSVLLLNLFLLHLPCCCRGLGHGDGFHLLSCDGSELVAFGLCSTGSLGAVCGVEGRRCGPVGLIGRLATRDESQRPPGAA